MTLQNDPFLSIANSVSNPYIEQTKRKIVGYYCTYVPEELLYAANLFPFRIRATGNEETNLADIYMVRFTCSFVRTTLDLALKGGLDFLDGYIACNSCDHCRRMFEIFHRVVYNRKDFNKKVPRFYFSVPHTITNEGFDWYKGEIRELKEELEKAFEINEISDNDLRGAIEVFNKNRNLLREIHKLRIENVPKISGTEALQISIANSSVPKDIANQELERVLNHIKKGDGIRNKSKRIMIVGSVIDNIDFIKLVEDSGATVVSDFLCFGVRNFLDDVNITAGGNPLDDISRRTYYRISCPRMMDDHLKRLEFIKTEVEKAQIDGVILQRIGNCDLHGCDNMLFEHELKDLEIPVLRIDRESFLADKVRLQTRIEAFLEIISK